MSDRYARWEDDNGYDAPSVFLPGRFIFIASVGLLAALAMAVAAKDLWWLGGGSTLTAFVLCSWGFYYPRADRKLRWWW